MMPSAKYCKRIARISDFVEPFANKDTNRNLKEPFIAPFFTPTVLTEQHACTRSRDTIEHVIIISETCDAVASDEPAGFGSWVHILGAELPVRGVLEALCGGDRKLLAQARVCDAFCVPESRNTR